MQFGIIGLGRMGGNMARRLRSAGLDVAGWDLRGETVAELAHEVGMAPAESPAQLVRLLDAPRIVWLMLPAGEITGDYVTQLAAALSPGDIVADGANSRYTDSVRRAAELAGAGVRFVDAGVSGGVWGLEQGYALMVGGEPDAVEILTPYLEALAPAPDKGWLHCGPAGAGHFTKMVHNAVEYAIMQSYAEGFALMKSHEEFDLDLGAIAEMWRHGSVIRSWLLDLTAGFLAEDADLDGVEPYVSDSGMGRWAAIDAIEQGVPMPAATLALMQRFDSRGGSDFGNRMLAMMRNSFGGHAIKER